MMLLVHDELLGWEPNRRVSSWTVMLLLLFVVADVVDDEDTVEEQRMVDLLMSTAAAVAEESVEEFVAENVVTGFAEQVTVNVDSVVAAVAE